ncbi:hypothetical protein [Photobacterium sp. J15]|nr:hypothetical protein [Photobacterium sp. J15]
MITDLTESNSKFIKHGLPRSQSFTVELAYYGEDLQNP